MSCDSIMVGRVGLVGRGGLVGQVGLGLVGQVGLGRVGLAALPYLASLTYLPLMNVPLRSSVSACCSSVFVFITIGPYHATGSSIGLPRTSREPSPSAPAPTTPPAPPTH